MCTLNHDVWINCAYIPSKQKTDIKQTQTPGNTKYGKLKNRDPQSPGNSKSRKIKILIVRDDFLELSVGQDSYYKTISLSIANTNVTI